MPKLAVLADPHSTHTLKWIRSLSAHGYEILLIGIGEKSTSNYDSLKNVHFECIIVKKSRKKWKLDFFKITNLTIKILHLEHTPTHKCSKCKR